jgi:DNA-binding HxlR family transcriptional regulator
VQNDSKTDFEKPVLPSVPMKNCPIESSLGVLGHKWTLLVLRNIGFLKMERFNQMLRVTPRLTPRVLSMRLAELEKSGLIKRTEECKSPKIVRWVLTSKGKDALPILMSIIEFGSRWYADKVFEDKKPRTLKELFPQIVK